MELQDSLNSQIKTYDQLIITKTALVASMGKQIALGEGIALQNDSIIKNDKIIKKPPLPKDFKLEDGDILQNRYKYPIYSFRLDPELVKDLKKLKGEKSWSLFFREFLKFANQIQEKTN